MTTSTMFLKSLANKTESLAKRWQAKKAVLGNVRRKYRARKNYRFKRIQYAQTISYRELKHRLSDVVARPYPASFIRLIHNVANSGIWIWHSYYKFFQTAIDPTPALYELEFSLEEQEILKRLHRHEKPRKETSDKILFSTIFKEIEYSQFHHHHTPRVRGKSSPITMVLISGVFNEIFSTPAFERAAQHLQAKYDIKFICPEVRGTKGSKTNAKLLERQLRDYISLNPKERLWVVAFSKGGVDALHFLKHNKEFAEKFIIGLSTIASPIMGSEHTENKLVKAVSILHRISDTYFSKDQDILLKEIYQSLSSNYQAKWFKRNADKLPDLNFYSSLSLKSSWYESHIWMLLTKSFFQSREPNDGIVDVKHAHFPKDFPAFHFGTVHGHHLIGSRSSSFPQEALLEAHLIALQRRGVLPEKK